MVGDSGCDSVLRRLDSGVAGPAVVRAAGAIQDSRAVDPLVALIGAPDVATRSAAATALGQLNDTRAVQALTAATQDPSHVVRAAASDALNTMGVAAVIVGVATVMRDVVRELRTVVVPRPWTRESLSQAAENSLPSATSEPQPQPRPYVGAGDAGPLPQTAGRLAPSTVR